MSQNYKVSLFGKTVHPGETQTTHSKRLAYTVAVLKCYQMVSKSYKYFLCTLSFGTLWTTIVNSLKLNRLFHSWTMIINNTNCGAFIETSRSLPFETGQQAGLTVPTYLTRQGNGLRMHSATRHVICNGGTATEKYSRMIPHSTLHPPAGIRPYHTDHHIYETEASFGIRSAHAVQL